MVVESAFKTSSKKKRKGSTKKTSSKKGTTHQHIVQKPNLESAKKIYGVTESVEIEEAEQPSNIPPLNSSNQKIYNSNSRGRFYVEARGNIQDNGRGRRPFF